MKKFIALSPLFLCSCTETSENGDTNSDPKTEAEVSYNSLKALDTNIHYVSFDAKNFEIEVADQPNGPGSNWNDTKEVAKAHNAVIAINAGFFTPEGKPLGICIDDGKKYGWLNQSSLGTGAYVLDSKGKMKIIKRADIKNYKSPEFLLQSGPFLVREGESVKVKASEARPRSFIAWDGKSRWLICYVEQVTLPKLSEWLGTNPFPHFNVKHALNLDGGRSCQFYIGAEVNGKEKQLSTFMNRKVRNFLVVKKR